MEKINELTLLSGNDIPFSLARLSIHQPRLKEIGFIGEENFHIGCHFLLFDKNNLVAEDNSDLLNQSNFKIFMSVMNSREKASHKTDALMVLALLFPEARIKIEQDKILLQTETFSSDINEQNFEEFQNIIAQIFCLKDENDDNTYNPADDLAKRIAEKLKKRKEKLTEQKGQDLTKIAIYSNFISILAVGLKKDMNELFNYTVYQLRDEFKRFQLKQDFDMNIKARLAGAQDLEEVTNWMENIHL